MDHDLYQVLGVTKDASRETIKKAYKHLAMIWHPDKNIENSEEAEEKFKDISHAYHILHDDVKRKAYDENPKSRLPRSPSFDSNGNYNPSRQTSFDRLYESIYGKMAKHRQTSDAQSHYSPSQPSPDPEPIIIRNQLDGDIIVDVFCTLEELFTGISRRYRIYRSIDGKQDSSMFEVKVFPGMENESRIIVQSQGNKLPGSPPNNICFVIRELPHEFYTRSGSNIIETVTLSLKQSLLGLKLKRKTLCGKDIIIDVDAPIPPGSQKKVKGHGMPRKDGSFGDLLFIFAVRYPMKLSDQQKALFLSALPDE